MKKLQNRLTSILLALIMAFVSYIAMPAKAIADEAAHAVVSEAIAAYAAANDFSQGNELKYSPLTGELPEERNESMKVFRRADGAQEAVVYSDPIHYLKDETWETIDNTLELVTLENGTQAYRNKANDFIVSLSPTFNADNLITVESKGHILSWRLTEEVPFVQEEPVKEETEAPEAEVPDSEEQPAEEPEDAETVEEPATSEEDAAAESVDDLSEGSAETEDAEAVNTDELESADPEDAESPNLEEAPSEEPEAAEEPQAEKEPAYETLKITDVEAVIVEREQKEPETDEERDMRLRYPEELTSELAYQDPETGLNVHYILSGKRLSEQIVLDRVPETAIAYTSLLTTNGLKAVEKDGRIVFVDESGETIFEILPPVMYDASGEESAEIEVRLIETADGYAYTLIPDEKWLKDESRLYPVTVDPDIQLPFVGNVVDTYVDSTSPNTNYSSSTNIRTSISGYRSLLKINNLPNLKSGDIVLNAMLHLTRNNSDGIPNSLVTGHQITEDWDISTVAFNSLPAYDDTAATFANASCLNIASNFDITLLVKGWYDGTIENRGLLLKSDSYVIFNSSEYAGQSSMRPSFSIIYRNSTGLESAWTYYSQSAGRAGTGSVNLASGNLTWTMSDGGITNGALPISLSHVYNVNDIDTNIGYGYGWRLNYTQTLQRFPVETESGTDLYYEYTDGDGTRHYYKYQEGEYVNELDKDSKLAFNTGGTEATITDKGDNKLVFQVFTSGSGSTLQKNGRLIRIEDANGNKTEITYQNPTGWSLQISKITEHLNGLSTGQELVLGYDNSTDLLVSVNAPNGLNITFDYSVNDDLSSVSYTDENDVTFNYSDHRLARATNIDGYNLRYVYNPRNGIRSVTEYAGNEEGQHLLFGYGRSKTVITDSQNRKTIYMMDPFGQTVSVTDPEGRAVFAAYNQAAQTVTQLSAVSGLQNTVVNLLKNHGFEQSSSSISEWNKVGTGISVDSSERKDGRRSVAFTSASGTRTLTQTVAVSSGKTYTLSAYLKGEGSAQMQATTGSQTFTGSLTPANTEDWTRATVTFQAAASSATVTIIVPAGTGTLHVDSVQLEESEAPNRYNMLENSDFRYGTANWLRNHTDENTIVTLSDEWGHPNTLSNQAFRFGTQMSYESHISQTITVAGLEGDTYSFGAWMRSTCPPKAEQTYSVGSGSHIEVVGEKYLLVEFLNSSDGTLGASAVEFAVDTTEWQFACGAAVAPTNYSKIRISAVTKRCIGETIVDGLQLYHETFSQAYSYDEDGNLTGSKSLIGQQKSFEYDDDNNVTKSIDPRGGETKYTYYENTHNVKDVETPEHVKTHYDYNVRGQVYHSRIGNNALHIDTSEERGNDGALTSKVIDARGNEVTYTNASQTRLNTKITEPSGNITQFHYGDADAMHRLAALTSSGLGVVTYGYDTYGKLTSITRGSTVYTLTYDDWNQPHETKVGSVTLSENKYDIHHRLSDVIYANGLTARYVYDGLDRVSKIYQKESTNAPEVLTYEMIYDGEGNLYEIRNFRTNRASFFEYDHAGRCMASKERSFTVSGGTISYGTILSSYSYQYDECNNLTKLTCSVAGSTWSTVYTYDSDNRASTTTLSSGKVLSNTFDALGRLQKRTLKQGNTTIHETTLTYVPGDGTNKTTALVATYQNGSDSAYSYEYDEVGNIKEITQGTTSISYEYDVANRLTRENNGILNQTITYKYDKFGNIQNKKIYAYTTIGTDLLPTLTPIDTIGYTYNSTDWADQLVQYGNETISYDEMGNPTTYRGYTFGWRGKQLTSASNGTNSLTFEYNEDGLRQKKTVNNVDTDYFYNGSVLIGMQRGTSKFLFSYDASGNVVSVNYNGTEYYYLRNAQGDIVKIIDAAGEPVVQYTYDTWGKKVSTTGDLAGTLGLFQPFRYRGYVYDWETGFYYLQSRYYDPITGRFISADTLLSTGQGVLGHNCYAHCLDNPVNRKDGSGACSYFLFWKTDCGDPSCPTSKNYNASEDFIKCYDKNVKCYGYVMKYVYARANIECDTYDTTVIQGNPEMLYNLDDVVTHMSNSIKNSGINVIVKETYDISEATDTDLVIAVRVASSNGGKGFFSCTPLRDDYHFAVRLKDNTWADKKGSSIAFVGDIKSGDEGWNGYWSDTKYIIVTFLDNN